jgi:hypothetical protein
MTFLMASDISHKIRSEHFDRGAGHTLANMPYGVGKDPGAAIRKIIAGYGSDHHILKGHLFDSFGNPRGFFGSGGPAGPWATAQKPQFLVHLSPKIKKWLSFEKNTPTHWGNGPPGKPYEDDLFLKGPTCSYTGPEGSLRFSQAGLGVVGLWFLSGCMLLMFRKFFEACLIFVLFFSRIFGSGLKPEILRFAQNDNNLAQNDNPCAAVILRRPTIPMIQNLTLLLIRLSLRMTGAGVASEH